MSDRSYEHVVMMLIPAMLLVLIISALPRAWVLGPKPTNLVDLE